MNCIFSFLIIKQDKIISTNPRMFDSSETCIAQNSTVFDQKQLAAFESRQLTDEFKKSVVWAAGMCFLVRNNDKPCS